MADLRSGTSAVAAAYVGTTPVRRFYLGATLVRDFEASGTAVTVAGELARWHTVVVDVQGPTVAEDDPINPFRRYRMQVTFTQGTQSFDVPGYFAADGDAANTGAVSGSVWRCLFASPTTGTWNYSVAFHQGTDAAAKLPGDNAGLTVVATNAIGAQVHGAAGSFSIGESDKIGPDLRAPNYGRLIKDGHNLRYAGSADHFEIIAGAGSPENFFGYYHFDGTSDHGKATAMRPGTTHFLHEYPAHAAHWQTGDPTWTARPTWPDAPASVSEAGKSIIGAINYLADQGTNSLYIVIYGVDTGDGKDSYPWIDWSGDSTQGSRQIYDVSKLEQWRIVLEHANHRGIVPAIFFQETENWKALDGRGTVSALGALSKVYIREIIARFGHLPGVVWSISEEVGTLGSNPTTSDKAYLLAWANHIQALDPWGSLTVAHNQDSREGHTFGSDSQVLGQASFDGMWHQTDDLTDYSVAGVTAQYIDLSTTAGRPYVIVNAEQDSGASGRPAEHLALDSLDADKDVWRKTQFYENLIAGGSGCLGYFGTDAGSNDQSAESFVVRQLGWAQCRLARTGFKDYVPFGGAFADNGKVSGVSGARCLAKPGVGYAVYLPAGGTASLDLAGETGTWQRRWFNPKTLAALSASSDLTGGGVRSLGAAPNTSQDWLGVVVKQSAAPAIRQLVLVKAPAGIDIAVMYDGMTIDLTDPHVGTSFAFRAVTSPGLVGSVVFAGPEGLSQTESTPPYYGPNGDGNADLTGRGWTPPSNGTYAVTATPYTAASGSGTAGTPLTINFTVTGIAVPGQAATTLSGDPITTLSGDAVETI